MSSFPIRTITKDEVSDYITTMFMAAGRAVDQDLITEQSETMDLGNSFAAFDGKEIVGTVGTRELEMTLPGGRTVPIAGIGQGGVLPSHTGKGIMRDLMIQSFKLVQDRGLPLAGWTTSAWPLYERYGGGVATFSASYAVHGLAQDAFKTEAKARTADKTRFAQIESAYSILPELHKKSATYPGAVSRDHRYWKRLLDRLVDGKPVDVLESDTQLPPPFFCTNTNDKDEVDGACLYRIHQRWQGGVHQSQMEIAALIYTNHEAARSLWGFLFNSGMIRSISMPHGQVDEPLRWMLKDGRNLENKGTQDHIWLRVIDPIKILSNRELPNLRESFRIAIHDPSRITDGIKLEIEPEGQYARVRQTKMAVDIEMGIGTLSSLVLGGCSVHGLAQAGRFSGYSRESLQTAQNIFSTSITPFCDNSF